MKKQNENNKLAFGKATVMELNNNQLVTINGGKNFTEPTAVSDTGTGTGSSGSASNTIPRDKIR